MSCIVVRWNPSRAKQLSAADRIWRRLAATCSSVTFGMSLNRTLTANVRYSIKNEYSFSIGGDRSCQQSPHRNRWKILAVLSLSLVVIGLDNTVMARSRSSIHQELGVSASTLQWIVDAYILVFAGLLLAAGNLGDPLGLERTLQLGLIVFGLASVGGAFAASGGQLIAARAVMGIGGALIVPATLSIIMDVFPREERGKAMSIWAAMAAVGSRPRAADQRRHDRVPILARGVLDQRAGRRGSARARLPARAREPRPESGCARRPRRAGCSRSVVSALSCGR